MSGTVYEYVMGAMYNNDNTTIMVGDSGFNQEIIDNIDMAKYIDKYTYGEDWSTERSRLGDAMGETYSWYADWHGIPWLDMSWIIRGGYRVAIEETVGIFCYVRTKGGSEYNVGFRLAVSVVS